MKSFVVALTIFFGMNVVAAEQPPPGGVAWFDIRVSEFKVAEVFYGKLFGWQFVQIFPGYKMISNRGNGVGGLTREGSAKREIQGSMIYFRVEDLRASFAQALVLGAKEELTPTDIPGFGSYAIIRDPDNNQIALFSEKALQEKKK